MDSTSEVQENVSSDWKQSLPEDIRNTQVIEQTKDVESLASQLVNSQKMLGGRIPIPQSDDKDGWNEVYTKLGRPEDANGYEFKAPEGVQLDDNLENWFKQAAHESNLTKSQANALYEKWNNMAVDVGQQHQQASEDALRNAKESLDKEWGNASEQNLSIAKKAISEFGGNELREYLDSSGLGNNPELIKFAHRVGKELLEDHAIGDGRDNLTLTPSEAQMKIADVMNNPNHLYHPSNAMKPGHQQAVDDMQKLFQMAHPEES